MKTLVVSLIGVIFSMCGPIASAQVENNLADLSISIFFPDGRYFSLKKKTELTLYGAGDYPFEVAILKARSQYDWGSEFQKFADYKSYSSVLRFKAQAFSKKILLPAGRYVLAVRNVKSFGGGIVKVELDAAVAPKGYTKVGTTYRKSGILTNVARKTYPFTVTKDHVFVIDGCNRHCYFWIIEQQWAQAFVNRQNFYYYPSYLGESSASPGRWVIDLPPGNYCLAASTGYDEMPYGFFMDEYRKVN